MSQMAYEQDLREDHQVIVERIAARRAEMEPIARRIDAIPGELLDTNDPDRRAELVHELYELERQRKISLIELGELKKRERVAHLAIFEAAEEQAHRAYQQAREAGSQAYHEANAITKEYQHAINGGIPSQMLGDLKAIDVYLAELAGKKAVAWALSAAADRDRTRARVKWGQAKQALQEAEGQEAKILPFPEPEPSIA